MQLTNLPLLLRKTSHVKRIKVRSLQTCLEPRQSGCLDMNSGDVWSISKQLHLGRYGTDTTSSHVVWGPVVGLLHHMTQGKLETLEKSAKVTTPVFNCLQIETFQTTQLSLTLRRFNMTRRCLCTSKNNRSNTLWSLFFDCLAPCFLCH